MGCSYKNKRIYLLLPTLMLIGLVVLMIISPVLHIVYFLGRPSSLGLLRNIMLLLLLILNLSIDPLLILLMS